MNKEIQERQSVDILERRKQSINKSCSSRCVRTDLGNEIEFICIFSAPRTKIKILQLNSSFHDGGERRGELELSNVISHCPPQLRVGQKGPNKYQPVFTPIRWVVDWKNKPAGVPAMTSSNLTTVSWDREDLRFGFLRLSTTYQKVSSHAQIWPQGAEKQL